MTGKRFIFKQDGNFHTVIDTVENKPMGVFEFKENEFPAYACFHMIIDKMNELYEENQGLIKEGKYQQRQKQRLINYLRQNLTFEEIREILNG